MADFIMNMPFDLINVIDSIILVLMILCIGALNIIFVVVFYSMPHYTHVKYEIVQLDGKIYKRSSKFPYTR